MPIGAEFDLNVRGTIPAGAEGTLLVATSRRLKDRSTFRRWHDSQAELLRLDVRSGSPGRVTARLLDIDPSGADVGYSWPATVPRDQYYHYVTQPNHAVNVSGNHAWTTNLLFGAPLEIDLEAFRATRVLTSFPTTRDAPQRSSTAHFAWSLDRRYAYYHQSLLQRETETSNVRSTSLQLLELDSVTGRERAWGVVAPDEDPSDESANFHSAFYFEEGGRRFVGLLRTGAVLQQLEPHDGADDHAVCRLPFSTIWIVEVVDGQRELKASVLPGLGDLKGIALSHLEVDNTSRDGFVLYANYKQADVAEETHGINVYGESPDKVREHYSGAVTEPVNFGTVLRYERRGGRSTVAVFSRPYDFERTSLGHSWMPINIQLDSSKRRLFCSFAGFKPRLLPRHIVAAYLDLAADYTAIRFVPPALLRLDARTLELDHQSDRSHISYSEPIAFTLIAGDDAKDYIVTFSTENGLRFYDADDLTRILAYASSARLHTWRDSHLRPEPAHIVHARLA